MAVELVDFGRLDAEAEVNLADYFVDTGVLGKLKDGRKHYVIGRKGAGKTALFRLATARLANGIGRSVIPLEFMEYPWEVHKLIRDTGLPAESAYVASWRFTFLVAVLRQWSVVAVGDVQREAVRFLRQIYQDEEPGTLEALVDRFRRIRKLKLPEATGVGSAGGFELDAKDAGPALAGTISQWSRVIGDFVEARFDRAPFTLALDRLDDGWDASEESRTMLAGVLKAARDLNLRLNRPGQPAAVLVFLRSDIYNELRFNDKNKIFADVEFLEWSDAKLISVVEARIARSLRCAEDEAWGRVFAADEMRQRASIRSYLLKRTMGRPRDIVAFALSCQETATGKHHPIVETQDVYEAEEGYSRHIYDELDDEMHKQLPAARDYLQALREIGRTRFSLNQWMRTLARRDKTVSKDEARAKLKVLFDYSIVGVPRRGGAEGGTTFQFNFHDRLLEPNFEQDVTVHPALKKHLKLTEGQ